MSHQLYTALHSALPGQTLKQACLNVKAGMPKDVADWLWNNLVESERIVVMAMMSRNVSTMLTAPIRDNIARACALITEHSRSLERNPPNQLSERTYKQIYQHGQV